MDICKTSEFLKINKKSEMKKIRKENNKKLLKHPKQIALISLLKIGESFFKSLLFSLTVFSLLKNESDINYFNNAFFTLLKPIKDLNRPVFFAVSSGILFVFLIIFTPLDYGILLWFSNLTTKKPLELSILFYYYRNLKLFLKTLWFQLETYFRLSIRIFLFLIPEILLFIYSCIKMQTVKEDEKFFLSFTVLFSILLVLAGIALFIKFGLKYLLLPFIQTQFLYKYNFKVYYKTRKKILNKLSSSKTFNIYVTFASFLFLLNPLVLPVFFTTPYFFTGVYSFVNNLDALED